MKCLGESTRVYIKRSVMRSTLSSVKRRAASIPISKKLFRSNALTAFMILGVLLAALTLSPMRGLFMQGGSVTAFVDESIATYAADFSTPKNSWNLGETANAKATGSPTDSGCDTGCRRIAWVAPDGKIAQVSAPYLGTLNDSYPIPSGADPFAQVGNWTVQTIDADGVANTSAVFVVHAATPNADLAIGKYGPAQVSAGANVSYRIEIINHGPDDAQTVTLTDSTPANTTFVDIVQTSGPTFTLPSPGVNGPCTIATLPVNGVAVFSFTFTVNSGTATDTAITNVADISSATNDPRTADNTAQSSAPVVAASTVCTLTCPASISTPAASGQCTKAVSYSAPTTSGACGTDPAVCNPPSGATFPIGNTTVNCNTTSGGECSFNVTVTGTDTTPPTITCPSNITTPEDPAGSNAANVAYVTPSATDNCTQDVQVFCAPPPGSSFPAGTTTVTCTATDASSNATNCTFTVTVSANTCAITCPANVTESTNSGCSKVVTYAAPTESGACGTVSCDPASGSSFPVGSTTVICTARDTSGNLLDACNFTVTVTGGTLTCPSDIVTNEDPPTSGSATVNYQEPIGCSGPAVTCNPASGSSFPVGTTTVTCGNTQQSCSFTVTVTTGGACVITCPNITKPNAAGQCGATATFPTRSGDCGSEPIFCSPPSGSFFPVGSTSVTCDINGKFKIKININIRSRKEIKE